MGNPNKEILEAAGSHSPRPLIWAAIRKLGVFDLQDILRQTDVHRETARDYIDLLIRAGVLRAQKQKGGAIGYILEKDLGQEPPKVTGKGELVTVEPVEQRLWTVARRLKIFQLAELVATASLPDAPISEPRAQKYFAWLRRAGYVTLRRASGKGGKATMRLKVDSGPAAPRVELIYRIYDPNECEVMATMDREGRHVG
ncbi:MAG: hypothetical protein AAF401_10410 [Pseudomonadota bacterium]